jgi:(p)ppGpp synthase/HD superfamily hydrolase
MLANYSNVTSLDSIEVETQNRFAFLQHPDDSVFRFFVDVLQRTCSATTQNLLMDAWRYANRLDYHHPGQSKEVYLAHPLRVATLYLRLVSPISDPGGVTALLHNAKEVSDVQDQDLERNVGMEVATAIGVLTVDRNREWDGDYKRSYYRDIESGPVYVAQVKILDKLDNLFLLCLNPSDDIRNRYLNEVEMLLLPMARKALPGLVDYLEDLVAQNRKSGHKPLRQTEYENRR